MTERKITKEDYEKLVNLCNLSYAYEELYRALTDASFFDENESRSKILDKMIEWTDNIQDNVDKELEEMREKFRETLW